jgi:hypothetical protein
MSSTVATESRKKPDRGAQSKCQSVWGRPLSGVTKGGVDGNKFYLVVPACYKSDETA